MVKDIFATVFYEPEAYGTIRPKLFGPKTFWLETFKPKRDFVQIGFGKDCYKSDVSAKNFFVGFLENLESTEKI